MSKDAKTRDLDDEEPLRSDQLPRDAGIRDAAAHPCLVALVRLMARQAARDIAANRAGNDGAAAS